MKFDSTVFSSSESVRFGCGCSMMIDLAETMLLV
ncbi:hypothetical protein LINGRAHAP2_LOCUS31015 [Linum grandiflorum]